MRKNRAVDRYRAVDHYRGRAPYGVLHCAWGALGERAKERDTQREREREREREKERDGSDVTLVALKLAKKFALFLALPKTLKLAKGFALFLAKNLHLSFSPTKWRWVHTFRCQNVAIFETVRILRKIRTLRVLPMPNGVTGDRSTEKKRSNFRLHRPSYRKNESN